MFVTCLGSARGIGARSISYVEYISLLSTSISLNFREVISPRFVPSIRTTCSKFAPSMGNSASVAKTTLSTVGAPVDGLFSLAFRSSTSTISVQDVKVNMDAAIIAKYFIFFIICFLHGYK